MLFNDPVRIYDCSNSDERPTHRGGGGPVMNDIMRYLHEHDEDYYYKFVDSAEQAEVIITNDVFPSKVRGLGKPLVKRMCSPYWNAALTSRNESLNESAQLADKVIFITEYSKDLYFNFTVKPLKSYCVVTHWVDPRVFLSL